MLASHNRGGGLAICGQSRPRYPHERGGSDRRGWKEPLTRQEDLLRSIAGHLETLARQIAKSQLGSPHLTIAEAATFLGCSQRTLKRRMAEGQIPFHHPSGWRPFFVKDELTEWLKNPATLCLQRGDRDVGQEDIHAETGLEKEEIKRLFKGALPPEDPCDGQD